MLPHSYWWPIDLHLIVYLPLHWFFICFEMTIQNKELIRFCLLTHGGQVTMVFHRRWFFFFSTFTYKFTIIYSGDNIKLTVDICKRLPYIYTLLMLWLFQFYLNVSVYLDILAKKTNIVSSLYIYIYPPFYHIEDIQNTFK